MATSAPQAKIVRFFGAVSYKMSLYHLQERQGPVKQTYMVMFRELLSMYATYGPVDITFFYD